MNVLSLFDGMSCGQIAFDKLGIKFDGVENKEEEEKAKKANTTKVARMLKGNLSKVLTRHERKEKGKTKIYISFNREMIDFLVNKKASTFAEVEAHNPKKQIDNNIISQNTGNDTTKR